MAASIRSDLKILGITPARGGSKGILRKNVRMVCGKPLVAWTISSALASRHLTRYVVSTEDPEIEQIAQDYGAEVIHRPAGLATDEATTQAVLQDILEKEDADVVVLLQCTSPVRDDDLIDRCIEKFFETDANSVATGFMCNLFEWGTYSARRQELQEFFHDDGNVYVMRADHIRQGDIWGSKREIVLTDREENVEIDDEFDLWLAEQILLKRIKEGK